MKTRTYLLLMLLAVILPAAGLATLGLAMLLQFEREARIHSIEELAHSTSLLIDREIARAQAASEMVAHSQEIRTGNLKGLYDLLSATRPSPLTWTLIVDESGSGLINTLVPYGTPLAKHTGPWAARIYAGQQSTVGGYFVGSASRRGVVSINTPVPAGTGPRYVVTQIFDPQYFSSALHNPAMKPGWIVGVFDAGGLTIARSTALPGYIGRPVRPELLAAARQQARGVLRHPTREGTDVYDMYVRSQLTGWTVAIGVPVAEIEAAAKQTTAWVALALLAVLGAAAALAVFFARRIDRALMDASAAAQALAAGRVAPPARSRLREADELLTALQSTSLALSQEEAARRALEHERVGLLERERAARLRAESQDRAKDSFIAMLGHELRNPLAALTSATTLLRLPGVGAPHTGKAWDIVTRQLAHMTHMVDDLLDVRRILTGKIELKRAPVNVGELLQFCCDSKMLSNTRQQWQVETVSATIVGDRARLMQVFDNLLENAIKFTPEGGRIHARNHVADGRVVIEIADSGIGMPADVIPAIFESLVQGPTALDRQHGGLGLGLAIARGLVGMHGGTIAAASPGKGAGSTFTVILPLAGAEGAAAPAQPEHAAPLSR